MSDNQRTEKLTELSNDRLLDKFIAVVVRDAAIGPSDAYDGPLFSEVLGEIFRRMAAPQGGPSADGWVSVEERLPEQPERLSWKDGPNHYWASEPVLVWDADNKRIRLAEMFRNHDGPKHWDDVNGCKLDNVTHWRPLPTPPVDPSPEKGND